MPHIAIALMAVVVHKLTEANSASYQRAWLRLRRRTRVAVGRRVQWAGRILARVTRWPRQK